MLKFEKLAIYRDGMYLNGEGRGNDGTGRIMPAPQYNQLSSNTKYTYWCESTSVTYVCEAEALMNHVSPTLR